MRAINKTIDQLAALKKKKKILGKRKLNKLVWNQNKPQELSAKTTLEKRPSFNQNRPEQLLPQNLLKTTEQAADNSEG